MLHFPSLKFSHFSLEIISRNEALTLVFPKIKSSDRFHRHYQIFKTDSSDFM